MTLGDLIDLTKEIFKLEGQIGVLKAHPQIKGASSISVNLRDKVFELEEKVKAMRNISII